MNANTVYDIFLALPETERQRHIELVNEYNNLKSGARNVQRHHVLVKPKSD
jgi:hypothetical protein